MDLGPDQGLSKGTIYSGIGHLGLILWVVVGDFFFAHSQPEVIEVTTVTMMSSEQFDAIQASAPAPSEVVSPEPPQEVVPEVAPDQPTPSEPSEPPPTPEPQPEIAPPPTLEPTVDPVPAPEPQPEDVVVAPQEQPVPSTATSMRPKPRPADRVAPDPVAVPEETVQTEAPPVEATSEQPAETPEVVPQEQPAAVPEDTGDVIRTEATEDQAEPLGMTASIRPKSRPSRPARTETVAEAATETAPETNTNTTSVDDALSAVDDPAPEPAQPTSGGSDAIVPAGPPLTGGEIGDVRAAIGGKWSLGTVSTEVMNTTIVVRVSFDPSGKPTDIKLLDSNGPSQAATDVAFRTARSAIVRAYQEGGIPLPSDKYETWKVLDLVFDPNGMRFR